jgi:hypothetical protein
MAILDIYLGIDNDYIKLINDIYKVVVILIIFQLLIYFSHPDKNMISNALTGYLLNDHFMELLIYIIIGICAYYLVFDKIISFY